jgi:hypothetical protein
MQLVKRAEKFTVYAIGSSKWKNFWAIFLANWFILQLSKEIQRNTHTRTYKH